VEIIFDLLKDELSNKSINTNIINHTHTDNCQNSNKQ